MVCCSAVCPFDGEKVTLCARIVDEISRIKKARHLPVSDPRRFQEVLDKAAAFGKGPLPADSIRRIYERIVEVMQTWEATR